jgi:hypothetical protein
MEDRDETQPASDEVEGQGGKWPVGNTEEEIEDAKGQSISLPNLGDTPGGKIPKLANTDEDIDDAEGSGSKIP